MALFIAAALSIVALKLWWAWFNAPGRVGARGERWVAKVLQERLPKEYHVLNDIYLPLPDGTTTQIDHIVVSRFGIFVIETKTYSGWIFGDKNSAQWTQSIYRKKSRFQNPLRQNYRHKCALADCLGIPLELFNDIVVFNGNCQFKTEMPAEVMRRGAVPGYITGKFTTPVLKDSEVSAVVSAISEWAATVGEEKRKSHVKNLQKKRAGVSANDAPPQCPYCGKTMVLRTARKSDRKFYGCPDYPKCRGMIKIA